MLRALQELWTRTLRVWAAQELEHYRWRADRMKRMLCRFLLQILIARIPPDHYSISDNYSQLRVSKRLAQLLT